MASPNIPQGEENHESIRQRRRRERWSAFFRPFLALTSIVVSVGLTLSLVKACQERFPNSPFNKAGDRQTGAQSPPETR
jgi:hypothetical protein